MDQDLQKRLRRLGLHRGTRHLQRGPRTSPQDKGQERGSPASEVGGRSLEQLFPGGKIVRHGNGACFVVDHVYPFSFNHGRFPLRILLEHSPQTAAEFNADRRLSELAFPDFLFLDTETTGLGGAGTIAFMVGAAFVEQSQAADVLVVRQYFLRDHADETAMLLMLDELAAKKEGLITFNGRSFDIPLLQNRYLMNRQPTALAGMPHIDLLPPSRRLWRSRFGSVALGNLEKELLGVRRTEEDIPGWLIPTVYNDYLRSGDAREIGRVFYHNQLDMLSMVTLAGEIMRQFSQASAADHPLDLLSLGRWQAALGMPEAAETNLRLAAEGDLPLEQYHQALKYLGALLKRSERRDEAAVVWQQWAATSMEDVEAHVELAMHFEWQVQDLTKARMWTARAMQLVEHWTPQRASLVRPSLEHRMARLKQKLGS